MVQCFREKEIENAIIGRGMGLQDGKAIIWLDSVYVMSSNKTSDPVLTAPTSKINNIQRTERGFWENECSPLMTLFLWNECLSTSRPVSGRRVRVWPGGSLLRIPSKSCRGKMHLKLGHFYQIRVTAWVVARRASCSWDRNKQCW